jgi:5-methylcytosine-specific restriction endonuclease McrA
MPEVAEPARRLRDLRGAGWVLTSSREDPSLAPQEFRFVRRGDPVWDKTYRSAGLRLLTSATRNHVLERDGYRCVRCGVGAGELYPEDPHAAPARLVVNHLVARRDGGDDTESNLVTECVRCSQLSPMRRDLRPEQVWRTIEALPEQDRVRVLAWLVKGGRDLTPAEQAFAAAWRLPAGQREALMRRLADLVAR